MQQELFPDFQVILVPGLHDSGAGHWQTLWHAAHPEFYRVRQDDWDDPDLPAWAAKVDQVRALDPRPALLVAHSFGCLASLVSIAAAPRGVAAAFLAAPADPEKFGIAAMLPDRPIGCPSVLVSSRDDPWMGRGHAALWARRWGSALVDVGALGHINAQSGLGDWQFGQEALQVLYERAHNERPAMSSI